MTQTPAADTGAPRDVSVGCSAANSLENLASQLSLLARRADDEEIDEITTTPIFTSSVLQYTVDFKQNAFSQHGLLAGVVAHPSRPGVQTSDPRVFYNVTAPSSVFICGSQGSGKSHSLSCLLENCLIPSPAAQLPRPLTGIVFHYDTFISDVAGQPCEAAFLSSSPDISVRVLCSPTNIRAMEKLYGCCFERVAVEPLRLNESDLNTKRMLDLMAVTTTNPPLYVHVLKRVLRTLRIEQQECGTTFDYGRFKEALDGEDLTEMQLNPLKQRLDTLESFMVQEQAGSYIMSSRRGRVRAAAGRLHSKSGAHGTDWTPKAGQLTVVDLSCPCITPEMACSLFNICLSLFLEQSSETIGRVVGLDEAHKYMVDSPDCQTLTESLLSTIRLQRHLGVRIFIATQEPTVSPKLLDLCSITLVHRFTSPSWLEALKKHLAGLTAAPRLRDGPEGGGQGGSDAAETDGIAPITLAGCDYLMELFSHIVKLRVGEALLFAPSAIIGVKRESTATAVDAGLRHDGQETANSVSIRRLGHGVLKVRVRKRVTMNGGQSVMAG